ncbi:MAG: aminotransferase class I/II-fold pyridoxal phosphate-dependent enzyme [Armatimonadetes bacterium]|nr:aminotransferase class I/II-fold pyridoxal phosphate-dependent enzyme [Armatimonadota bacterium]
MTVRGDGIHISSRARDLPPSGIREFFDLVAGMEDVISLGVGEPDFPTPWRICDAAIHSLYEGFTSYTSNSGMIELRGEISSYLERRFGVRYDPETEIIVTVGVSEAIDLALRVLLEPGDSFLVPDPSYVSYAPSVALADGVPVSVPTTREDEFKLRADALADACDDRTRGLLFSNPCNPTGAVMDRDDLAELAGVVTSRDLFVISDEVYAELTYGAEHVCTASLPGMRERTLVLNGFSKADAMTGWRIGYACGPAEVIGAMLRIHAYTAMCVPTMAQVGAIEALRHGDQDRARMIAEYDQRRRIFVNGLNRIGLECHEPRGAFYAFPSITSTGLSSRDFSRALLTDQRVAAVPGIAFGKCGEGHIRCTYASSVADLREALARMERFLERLARGEVTLEDSSIPRQERTAQNR